MNIHELIQGAGGLISGLGTLLVGVAALWPHIKRIRRKERTNSKNIRPVHAWTLWLSVFLLLVSASIFAVRAFSEQEQPLNVQLTTQAWDAFNKGKYEEAISIANKCIDEFQGAANRQQVQLAKDSVPLPPNGAVPDNEKQIIFSRGLLNDVATCFYIQGRSAENLGRKENARQAYQAASKYTYARCWDPRGWFWAPSEAATDRLSLLN